MKSNRLIKSFAVCSLSLFLSCVPEKSTLVLPVFGPKQVVNGDTVYHQVQNFELVNQYGDTVNQNTLTNKIVVANFFFATCQSICPEMSNNLKDVQAAFLEDENFLILSHSVNPLHDTVEVLKIYSELYGAKQGTWHLLTGDKKQIYGLAKNSYLVNALEDDGSPEGFLHSELFLLVDSKGRLRGMYDGTNKVDVQKLITDVRLLKTEH